MTDLLDAPESDATAPAAPSWSAPSGAPTPAAPSIPAPPVPAPTVPTLAPAPSAGGAPTLSVPDHQPRQDRNPAPLPGTLPGTFPVDLGGLQPVKQQPLVRWGAILKTVFWICGRNK